MMDNMAMMIGCKVMHTANDDQLDKAVYLRFTQKHSQNRLISGPVFCEKAVRLHRQFHDGELVPPFQASRGSLSGGTK